MGNRILIVDDEADLIDAMTTMLENAGYIVEESQSGAEGLGTYIASLLKEAPYDLILLDIRMPGMSGIEVLESIRKVEQLRGIQPGAGVPIILLSGYKQPFLTNFNRECDDFMMKPVEERALLEKIEQKTRPRQLN